MWITVKGLIALLMVPLVLVGYSLITHISLEPYNEGVLQNLGFMMMAEIGLGGVVEDFLEMNEQSRLVGGLFFIVVPGLFIWRLGFWQIFTFIRTLGRKGKLAMDEY